ncbi:MAG: hypothetical protein AAGG44_18805, partial [Planctomycetota bacterium]
PHDQRPEERAQDRAAPAKERYAPDPKINVEKQDSRRLQLPNLTTNAIIIGRSPLVGTMGQYAPKRSPVTNDASTRCSELIRTTGSATGTSPPAKYACRVGY